jgi:cytochrome c-type biogenesis protein CcmF
VLKGKWKVSGGSVSHIGFGVMMVGILISQGEQQVISLNKFGINYGSGFSDEENEENVLLYQYEPQDMGKYRVTYLGDSVHEKNIYFNVRYEELDKKGKVTNAFTLHPNILINAKMGNNPIPSTKKTVFSDLYTHITSAPINEDGSLPDSIVQETHTVGIGDTVAASRCLAVVQGVNPKAVIPGFEMKSDDIAIGIPMQFITMDTSYMIEPIYFIRDMVATSVPVSIPEMDLKFAVSRIIPEENKFEVIVEQKLKKYMIMKAIRFPFINVLWLGILILLSGIYISLRKSMEDNRSAHASI